MLLVASPLLAQEDVSVWHYSMPNGPIEVKLTYDYNGLAKDIFWNGNKTEVLAGNQEVHRARLLEMYYEEVEPKIVEEYYIDIYTKTAFQRMLKKLQDVRSEVFFTHRDYPCSDTASAYLVLSQNIAYGVYGFCLEEK